jgi:hypothetical protein
MRYLLAPLTVGLAVLDKVWDVVAGTPNIPPTPVTVLDGVGPWADALDAL